MKLIVSHSIVDKLAAVLLTGTLFALSVVLTQFQAQAKVFASDDHPPSISPLPLPLPPPTITQIDPASGPDYQRVHITISGANFVKTPYVKIGHAELDDVVFVSSSQINAIVPSEMTPGKYDVRVCNPDRQCAQLSSAYTVFANPYPTLQRIEPEKGLSDRPNEVLLSGHDLQPGIQITIGNVPLQNIRWIRSSKVRAVVPAGLPAGIYAVLASNPGAPETSVLEHAYTVVNSIGDDFFASEEDLRIGSESIRPGDVVKLGLKVHRKGGKDIMQVEVAFYLGDPAHGGILLGQTTTAPMAPGSDTKTVAITWNTTGVTSPAQIYAVIDPNNLITETNKHNNKVMRTIRFLPHGHQ